MPEEQCLALGLISFSGSDVNVGPLSFTSGAVLAGKAVKSACDVNEWGARITSPIPHCGGRHVAHWA